MPHTVTRFWRWPQRIVQLLILFLIVPVSATWSLPGLLWMSLWWWRRRLQPAWYAAVLVFLFVQVATLRQESWVWWLLWALLWEVGQIVLEWLPIGWKRSWIVGWGMLWSASLLWWWGSAHDEQAWLWLGLCGLVWLGYQGKGWFRYERE